MISASLAVEGHARAHGLQPYMTYPEPWRGPPKPPAEFLRPAPKPLNSSRYNGVVSTAALNGTRLGGGQTATVTRPTSKYPSPPAAAPVNLTQQHVKEENGPDDQQQQPPPPPQQQQLPYTAYSRLYQPHHTPFTTMHTYLHQPAYTSLYPAPFSPLMRPSYAPAPPPPLSPLDTYTPPTGAPSSPATYLPPPPPAQDAHSNFDSRNFSPPTTPILKPGQSLLRDRKAASQLQQQHQQQQQQLHQQQQAQQNFKVPSGKEGSLKHRILTNTNSSPSATLVGGQTVVSLKQNEVAHPKKKYLPSSPGKPLNTNNNTVPQNFTKGSLIQLANGELRRVEDMRTEDFVLSAERSPELRLADSTVVRIEENPITGTATITLSYNQRRTQVEFESSLEHPFFVYGQGWASCTPDRTLQSFGLKVHRLQVGDILISLVPREPAPTTTTAPQRSSTIITTATTTAMTVRQVNTHQHHPVTTAPLEASGAPNSMLPESSASRKRRWSAPEICDEDEKATRRLK